MNKQLQIKYLVSGAVEVTAPTQWDSMSYDEKTRHVAGALDDCSDDEIIEGLRDSEYGTQMWDEAPPVATVSVVDGSKHAYDLLTSVWFQYVFGTATGIDGSIDNPNLLKLAEEVCL